MNTKPFDSCWNLWHKIFNLLGRLDNKDWIPLFQEAIRIYPDSSKYQGKLLLGIYGWYTADAPQRAWVFSQIERHAKEGVAWAVCKMGSAYYHGLEVERDWSEAYRWFSRAAQEEQAEAQCRLAGLLRYAAGEFQDTRAALNLYLRVATKRYSAWQCEAPLACAEIYAFGIDVPEDRHIARYLLELMLCRPDRSRTGDRDIILRTAKHLNIL